QHAGTRAPMGSRGRLCLAGAGRAGRARSGRRSPPDRRPGAGRGGDRRGRAGGDRRRAAAARRRAGDADHAPAVRGRRPATAATGDLTMADPSTADRDDIASLSVRRPVLTIVANLLIVIAGLAALLGVEVRELPDVDRPVVTVRATYEGAAPETMDTEVTKVIEGAIARVSGVTTISASSEESSTRIVVEFDPSVDLAEAANDLREAVARVERRLPEDVEDVVVVKADDNASPIVRLAVSSDRHTQEELTRIVEDQIVPELSGVPGVADVP